MMLQFQIMIFLLRSKETKNLSFIFLIFFILKKEAFFHNQEFSDPFYTNIFKIIRIFRI